MCARSCFRAVVLAWLLVFSASACRRQEPPPAVAKNLGTAERPLLPGARRRPDPSILGGRAVPVRAGESAEDQPEASPTSSGELSDEDRELIEEVVALAIEALAEERPGDLGELIVPAQQEKLGRLFEQVAELAEANSRLGAQILEKAPQMAAALAGMMGMPGLTAPAPGAAGGKPTPEQLAQLFKISDLRMTTDDQAVATIEMTGRKFPVDLWVVDDEWYIHLPELLEDPELIEELVQLGELITQKIEDLATRLEDGTLAPEALMPEFVKMGQELMPVIMELAPRFQALAAEASPDAEHPSEGVDGDELPGDVRQAIERLQTDWDGAFAERRLDDLARLHPPEHREAAKRRIVGLLSVLDSLEEFAGALDDASPGAGTVIRETASEGMAKGMSFRAAISDLRLDSPDRAVAKEGLGEFRRVEGQWYLWNPDLADPQTLEENLDEHNSVASRIRTLTEQVKDGRVTVPEAMTHFAAIFQGSDAG